MNFLIWCLAVYGAVFIIAEKDLGYRTRVLLRRFDLGRRWLSCYFCMASWVSFAGCMLRGFSTTKSAVWSLACGSFCYVLKMWLVQQQMTLTAKSYQDEARNVEANDTSPTV